MTHSEEEVWEDDSWKRGREDVACTFHNKTYLHHDFYYGDQCRRCGVVRFSEEIKQPLPPLHVDEKLITYIESGNKKDKPGILVRLFLWATRDN